MTDQDVKEGIVQDSDTGYEKATVATADSPKVDHGPTPSVSVEEFVRNYPILTAEGRAKHFQKDEVYLINDYALFPPSGILATELRRAVGCGLISYRTTQIAEPENPTTETDQFIVTPTTKLLNLLDDLKMIPKEKPGRKSHETQITIEGKTRYMSDRVRMILDATPKVLADTAQGNLAQIRNTQNKKVRRRLLAELHDIALLRGEDLPRHVYGSLCLRLGMPLPPDFWSLPPEILGLQR